MSDPPRGSQDGSSRSGPLNEDTGLSLFTVVSATVRRFRLIVCFMVIGAVVAVVPVISRKYMYEAKASFAPLNADQGRAGLSALAGAFGISVPTGGGGQSPEFYADLLHSRVVLAPILNDTFPVAELGGERRTLVQLFEIEGQSPERTVELGVESLASAIKVNISKGTGIVMVSVTTPWRSVSLQLVEKVLTQVNAFNLRTRQSQAAEERRFVEERLDEARASLRYAEARLEAFLRGNRQSMYSPELTLARDRLQRDVDLNQQVATALAQSLEDTRIREVRNVPVITVIEPPMAETTPESRGRFRRAKMGLMLGGLVGVILAVISQLVAARLAAGDPQLQRFKGLFMEVRSDLETMIPGRRRSAQPRRASP